MSVHSADVSLLLGRQLLHCLLNTGHGLSTAVISLQRQLSDSGFVSSLDLGEGGLDPKQKWRIFCERWDLRVEFAAADRLKRDFEVPA